MGFGSASISNTLCIHYLCLVLFITRTCLLAEEVNIAPVSQQEMYPVASSMTMMEDVRRQLGSFQVCALCTCCGGPRGLCIASPCCYSINCNIPNRPFGYCSFMPNTCNCFGCHL